MEKSIFKGYDIRGIWGNEINEETLVRLARAFLSYFSPSMVCLARDSRKENKEIYDFLLSFFTSHGIDVIALGKIPTTIFYHFVSKFSSSNTLSLICTSSHNPSGWVGIKIMYNGKSLLPAMLRELKEVFEKEKNTEKKKDKVEENTRKGIVKKINYKEFLSSYISFVFSSFPFLKDINTKVIFDIASSSFSSPLFEEFLKYFPKMDAMILNIEDTQGDFPHNVDTSAIENYSELKSLSQKFQRWGIGFDGDADRVIFFSPTGQWIRAEDVLYLVSDLLQKHRILMDISSSHFVYEEIKRNNNKEISYCKTGHLYIKEKMNNEKWEIAAERSGHFYLLHNDGVIEDAILFMLLFLYLVSFKEKEVKEYLTRVSTFFISEKIRIKEGMKWEKVKEKIKEMFAQKDGEVIEIDGIKIVSPSFWFIVRKSNTEPIIRVVMEFKEETAMRKIYEILKSLLVP